MPCSDSRRAREVELDSVGRRSYDAVLCFVVVPPQVSEVLEKLYEPKLTLRRLLKSSASRTKHIIEHEERRACQKQNEKYQPS